MIRNILDSLGNVIGTLNLPDDTPESVWQSSLAIYSTVNPPSSPLKLVNTYTVTDVAAVTTSSSTPSTIGNMTFTPPSGKYLALFSGSIYTDGASAKGEFGIYINGTQLTETRRDISCALTLLGGLVSISLNAIGVGTYTGTQVELNGADIVDVRFKSLNGGTIGFKERTFILIKVE